MTIHRSASSMRATRYSLSCEGALLGPARIHVGAENRLVVQDRDVPRGPAGRVASDASQARGGDARDRESGRDVTRRVGRREAARPDRRGPPPTGDRYLIARHSNSGKRVNTTFDSAHGPRAARTMPIASAGVWPSSISARPRWTRGLTPDRTRRSSRRPALPGEGVQPGCGPPVLDRGVWLAA